MAKLTFERSTWRVWFNGPHGLSVQWSNGSGVRWFSTVYWSWFNGLLVLVQWFIGPGSTVYWSWFNGLLVLVQWFSMVQWFSTVQRFWFSDKWCPHMAGTPQAHQLHGL